MKRTTRLAIPVSSVVLALALTTSVKADYGAYRDALSQLRTARAYIEHPDVGELHDQEKSAIAEMDAAIKGAGISGQ